MQPVLSALRGLIFSVSTRAISLWKKYRALSRRTQIIGVVVFAIVLITLVMLLGSGKKESASETLRFVTLRSVGELSGGTASGTMFGVIRSVSEATVLAETSGSVTAVHTALGSYVGAGAILAELENASERATVLQAEGVYDAAVAARDAVSLSQTELSAEATYRNAFATLDDTLETDVDAFFSGTASTPNLNIDGGGFQSQIVRDRARINEAMTTWRYALANASSETPETLLTSASAVTKQVAQFLNDLAQVANRPSSRATSTQLSGLATARSTVNTLTSTLESAKSTYRSGSVGASASADATLKQALGALRGAQATLEKTRFRAPIAGTVNFLPLRVGDFVTQNMHVATIAQNQTLEAVAYVSEDTRTTLEVGAPVIVEGTYAGLITAIAPALDPVTKQIEIRIAITNPPETLVNGSSVKITLPDVTNVTTETGPLSLPLTSVKLRADDRVVFGINEEGRLVAYTVTTGAVHGDRIEITNELSRALSIVTDARGLSEGQRVSVTE